MDVVVTVPKARWAAWLAEGDLPAAGENVVPEAADVANFAMMIAENWREKS
jgi:hypothetical protein